MKLKIQQGSTSQLAAVFIQDSSATDGSGLTGLAYNSSGLTWYWFQSGDASATQVTPATATVGTWASGGFVEVDATNMPGVYEIGIPDAAINAAGITYMMLKGATNMAPVLIEIECDEIAYQSATQVTADLSSAASSSVNAELVDVINVDTLVAGVTVAEALRRIGAVCSYKISGAGSGTETVTPWDNGAETIVFTVDSSGNRTSVTFN